MAISFNLGFNPFWYIADIYGRPLAGGKMWTFESGNPNIEKSVFFDNAGVNAWPNPVIFDSNGQQGPFYFEFDSSNPTSLYYIRVTDSHDNTVWTIDHFTGGSGGGGSVVTTALDLENYIANSEFWRNVGTVDTSAMQSLTLLPSNNSGFAANAIPDVFLQKSSLTAVDQISFPTFIANDLTGDVTPQYYMKYQCTNTPTGETAKNIFFPICHQVQNLSNQNMTFSLWARVNSGNNQLQVQFLQFYGDGPSASPSVASPVNTMTLSASWQKFIIPMTVPNASSVALGECANDALYVKLLFPLNAAYNIDIAKPSLYLGTNTPNEDFHTYDEIDSIISKPRTGDVRISLNSFAPYGWVACNDGVLQPGDPLATYTLPAGVSLARNNRDTFPLYYLIWNSVSNTYAPIYNMDGTVGTRTTAIDDWVANKQLKLTRQLGRVISTAGQGEGLTNWSIGQFNGEETHSLTTDEMPPHTHNVNLFSGATSGSNTQVSSYNDTSPNGNFALTSSTGGVAGTVVPHNTIQPTVYMNVFLKL